jgi:hypothetical protein
MIAPSSTTPARRAYCPDRGRELAAQLSALFTREVVIVKRLNDAKRRLERANDRLWSGVAPDSLGLVYDGAGAAGIGGGELASLMRAGGTAADTVVLEALQQIHATIHGALHQYQDACEERRQLAVEVGEYSQQLTEVLCAVGWSADQARAANVDELAGAGAR